MENSKYFKQYINSQAYAAVISEVAGKSRILLKSKCSIHMVNHVYKYMTVCCKSRLEHT